jgi:hypothetical protein
MSTIPVIFAVLLAAVLILFTVRNDTYHSPQAAAGFAILRVLPIAAVLVLLVAVPTRVEREPPKAVFVIDADSPNFRRSLARLKSLYLESQLYGYQPRLFIVSEETPVKTGQENKLKELPHHAFPSWPTAVARAKWDVQSNSKSILTIIAPASVQQGLSDDLENMEINWITVDPGYPQPHIRLREGAAVMAGMTFNLDISISRPPTGSTCEIWIDDTFNRSQSLTQSPGQDTKKLDFPISIGEPGLHSLMILLRGEEGQVVDRLRTSIEVRRRPEIRYVAPTGMESPFFDFLKSEGFAVRRWSVADLLSKENSPVEKSGSGDLIILDSPPQGYLTGGVSRSAANAARRGSSFLVIPGTEFRKDDFGRVFETLLPVRPGLEGDDREDRSLALVAVVDTSMSMQFGKKMDMAKIALVNLATALRDDDLLGVMGTDFNPYWIFRLGEFQDAEAIKGLIGRIRAFGPGINLYSSLLEAYEGLAGVEADIKHVIVLGDTADIDEYEIAGTGNVWTLLDTFRRDGITVSVVGFGDGRDEHVPFLNRFVQTSGGYFYLSSRVEDIPGFFLEDLDQVSDSMVINMPLEVQFNRDRYPAVEDMPGLMGQALFTSKPGSDLQIWSERGYPLLVAWRMGKGRSAVFAADSGSIMAPSWFDRDKSNLWNYLLAALLPAEHGGEIFYQRAAGGLEIIKTDPRETDTSIPGRIFDRQGYSQNFLLEKKGPHIYSVTAEDIPSGSYRIEIADGPEAGGGLTASSTLTVEPPPVIPPPTDPVEFSDVAPGPPLLSDTIDTFAARLLLLAVIGLLVIDEVFRFP